MTEHKIKKYCKECNKIFYVWKCHMHSKFCSKGCHDASQVLPRIEKKCKYCKKTFNCLITSTQQYCSLQCCGQIVGKTNGKNLGTNTNKKYGGWWGFNKVYKEKNPELYRKILSSAGKKGTDTMRRKNIGAFHDPKQQRIILLNQRRNRHSYYFKGIYYDSNQEREFALNIYYQQEKLVLWKNYQFVVNRKFIDFFIKKYKCFIEFHPLRGETLKEYFNSRRQILDKGGFKDYNLIIIT